MKRINTRL